jgi:hypothetical protein
MSSRRPCADSRLSAGPSVNVVAKIHNAVSAAIGTATKEMIFERIDQLRVFISPRPRVGRIDDTCPVRSRQKADTAGDSCALGRIRKHALPHYRQTSMSWQGPRTGR